MAKTSLGCASNPEVTLFIETHTTSKESGDELEAPSGYIQLSYEDEGKDLDETLIDYYDAATLLEFVTSACLELGVDVLTVVTNTMKSK